MHILLSLFQSIWRGLTRNLYWFSKTLQIKSAKGVRIHFPIRVEGAGRIVFEENATIGKMASFLVAENSSLKVGKNAYLHGGIDIRVGKNSSLTIGNDFSIEKGSRLFINEQWSFGDKVKIATQCSFFSREPGLFGKLEIGEGSVVGDNTIIDVSDLVSIGKNVAIGPNCTIYTHDHNYTDITLPAWQGEKFTHPVVIRDGAWIGSNVTILPGITIGKNAVIAAGSVITKDIDEFSVWAGIPAKKIRDIVKRSIV